MSDGNGVPVFRKPTAAFRERSNSEHVEPVEKSSEKVDLPGPIGIFVQILDPFASKTVKVLAGLAAIVVAVIVGYKWSDSYFTDFVQKASAQEIQAVKDAVDAGSAESHRRLDGHDRDIADMKAQLREISQKTTSADAKLDVLIELAKRRR